MAWIESHQNLGSHPKMIRLADRMKIHRAQAVGHLHYLWWWALDYADDGNLSGFSDAEIAVASQWLGNARSFVNALRECTFIDDNGAIHDWAEFTGRIVDLRLKNRQRKRVWRLKNTSGDVPVPGDGDVPDNSDGTSHPCPGDVPVTEPSCPADVTRTSQSCPTDVTGPSQGRPVATQPNPTKPNQIQETPPIAGACACDIAEASDKGEGNANGNGEAQSGCDPTHESVMGEWPTRAEWHSAAEMEGLPPHEEQAEWDNQERKVGLGRWRGISVDRLRHHAAFVRTKWQQRGSPGANGGRWDLKGSGGAKKATVFETKTRMDAIESEIREIRNRGTTDALSWRPACSEDRSRLSELKKTRDVLRKELTAV